MNISIKEFIILVELRQLFPHMAFVYAWIVPLWANQLLLQLLMEQFDTLRIQCRHIEHMDEGVYNFVCTDSTEIFFSKLRSSCSNFNLPSTVLGVSNKHCLLTFFILFVLRNIIIIYSMYSGLFYKLLLSPHLSLKPLIPIFLK